MQADGDRREVGGTAGPDCVIAVLPDGQAIGTAERRALRALADAGLIPDTGLIPNTGQVTDTGQISNTGHKGPSVTTRIRIHRVKAGPRVVESVESTLALH